MKISRFVSDSLGGLGASVERRYWAQVLCPLHFQRFDLLSRLLISKGLQKLS